MPGTGLYCVKAVPAQHNDTQSGAPVGQVITLTTGGLGATGYEGGYVTNTTRGETRSIVSHTDTTVTLEGLLANWLNTDVLQCFDSWATVQGALTQLWTDQAAVAFTASQYIRIFAGTYAEQVTPNAGLNPDEANGYWLIIEGDPSDDRDNIIIAPAGTTYSVYLNCDSGLVRHLKIAGTPTSTVFLSGAGCVWHMIDDCYITNAAGKTIHSLSHNKLAIFLNSVFEATANSYLMAGWNRLVAARCKFIGPGKATSTGLGIRCRALTIQGCVVAGWDEGISLLPYNATAGAEKLDVRNCTVYDCSKGIEFGTIGHFDVDVTNCIFKDVTYPYYINFTAMWPEETATRMGGRTVQRNNCYHGYTAMAYDGTTAKTYAEWIAFNQVDSAGELDATDPLMTNPGADDFTLQVGSPCRRAGIGSGVPYDVDGDAFDPFHPDIGAVTTGVGLWRKPEELLEVD